MDSTIMDTSTMSPRDKAILMLIERIEQLEDELQAHKKEALISNILACHDKCTIYTDTFMYLLGIPPKERSPNDMASEIARAYKDGVTSRVMELSALSMGQPVWELASCDLCARYSDVGENIHAVLAAMTQEELDGLWRYISIKTKIMRQT